MRSPRNWCISNQEHGPRWVGRQEEQRTSESAEQYFDHLLKHLKNIKVRLSTLHSVPESKTEKQRRPQQLG